MNTMTDLAGLRAGHVLHEKMRIGGERVGAIRVHRGAQPVQRRASSARCRRRRSTTSAMRSPIARAYKPTLTRYERYEICQRTAELIRARAEAISDLITAECGISKKDSLYEVGRACDVFVFAGNAALQDDGQVFSLRPDAARQVAQGLHAARAAARRHHRDHAVQPSAEPGRAQGRAVDRDQQPDGAEADREDAAVGARARRHPLRSGPAAADVLRSSPATRARSPTRCSSTRTSTSSRSPAACRSASTSPPRRSTSARCSSSAATTRSS